jgi:hypothetical protein
MTNIETVCLIFAMFFGAFDFVLCIAFYVAMLQNDKDIAELKSRIRKLEETNEQGRT